jgi:Tfp pilus assembly protein PilW
MDATEPTAERGFTIVELLITVTMLLVVLGIIMDGLIEVTRSEAFQESRNESLDSMRTSLNRLTKELRQASSISSSSDDSRLEFSSYVNGAPTAFVYQASGATLTRQVNGGSAVPMELRLATADDIFTYTPTPASSETQWVKIVLQVHPRQTPDTTLVLDSQVNLRNRITS